MVPMTEDMVDQVIPGASALDLDWTVPNSMWVIQGPLPGVNKLLATVVGCRVGPRKKILEPPRKIQVRTIIDDTAVPFEPHSLLTSRPGTEQGHCTISCLRINRKENSRF